MYIVSLIYCNAQYACSVDIYKSQKFVPKNILYYRVFLVTCHRGFFSLQKPQTAKKQARIGDPVTFIVNHGAAYWSPSTRGLVNEKAANHWAPRGCRIIGLFVWLTAEEMLSKSEQCSILGWWEFLILRQKAIVGNLSNSNKYLNN